VRKAGLGGWPVEPGNILHICNTFPRFSQELNRSVFTGREEQIDLLTAFGAPPQVVFPADALGNRARFFSRELKGIGATHKEA